MHDDEIDALIQTMKDAGITQARVRRTLEVLGQAEALGSELWADAAPSEKQRIQETVAAALLRMFREEAQSFVK